MMRPSEISEYFLKKYIELEEDDELDEVYSEWDDHVNMTASELERWSGNPCSREASKDPEAVIKRNLRLLEKNKDEWDSDDIEDAKRTISFISRMRANEPDEPREGPHGCPSEWAISLLNWAFNPFDSVPDQPDDDDLDDVEKITMQEFKFSEDDKVEWQDGNAMGVVRDRTNDSCYDAAIDGDVKVCGEMDNPAYLIEIYDDEEEELTGTMVAHKEDTLSSASFELAAEEEISNPDYEFTPVPTQVVYDSRERAMRRAESLGLDGVHIHEVDGTEMYMPGSEHSDWLDALKGDSEEMKVQQGKIYSGKGEKVFDLKKVRNAMEGENDDSGERLYPTDLKLNRKTEQEGNDYFRSNWQNLFKEENREFVFQAHWMGLDEEQVELSHSELLDREDVRVHGDLRMALDNSTGFGFTTFEDRDDIEGKSEFLDASERKEPNEDRIQGEWKQEFPEDWMELGFDDEVVFEPGEQGATEDTFGKLFGIEKGTWTPGVVHKNSVELFLESENIDARAIMSFVPLPNGNDTWVVSFPENQTPEAEQKSLDAKITQLQNSNSDHERLIWNNPNDDEPPQEVNINRHELSEDNVEEITVEEMNALF